MPTSLPQALSLQCHYFFYGLIELNKSRVEIFRQALFTKFKSSTGKEDIHALLSNSTLQSTFRQLVTMAMILVVFTITTSIMERSLVT